MNTFFRFITITCTAMVITGCAALDDRIHLTHTPDQNIMALAGAQGKKAGVSVNVQRPGPASAVGVRKDARGRVVAAIEVMTPISQTFERAIASELSARGFTVDPRAPEIMIDADVSKFWSDFQFGLIDGEAIAELTMTVRVQNRKKQLIYDRTVIAQGVEKHIFLVTGGNAKLALEDALSEALRMLFSDPQFIAALSTEKVQIIRSSLTNVGSSL